MAEKDNSTEQYTCNWDQVWRNGFSNGVYVALSGEGRSSEKVNLLDKFRQYQLYPVCSLFAGTAAQASLQDRINAADTSEYKLDDKTTTQPFTQPAITAK